MTDELTTVDVAARHAPEATQATPIGHRIVVGVDGSAGSMAALQWATREAKLRGASVHVVMAWQQPQSYGAADVCPLGADPSMDTQRVLAASATAQAARCSRTAVLDEDVITTWEALEGPPGHTLLAAAEDADLLVVGSRGHGRFVGTLLGSVSQHVIVHGRCPVVVVPDIPAT